MVFFTRSGVSIDGFLHEIRLHWALPVSNVGFLCQRCVLPMLEHSWLSVSDQILHSWLSMSDQIHVSIVGFLLDDIICLFMFTP